MITKQCFIKVLSDLHNVDKYIDASAALSFDVMESPLYEAYSYMLDRFWKDNFTKDACQHIDWFIYEHHDMAGDFDDHLNMLRKGRLGIWDENDNPIPMDTIDDLWKFVEDSRI